jgi:hypothetical protein
MGDGPGRVGVVLLEALLPGDDAVEDVARTVILLELMLVLEDAG